MSDKPTDEDSQPTPFRPERAGPVDRWFLPHEEAAVRRMIQRIKDREDAED